MGPARTPCGRRPRRDCRRNRRRWWEGATLRFRRATSSITSTLGLSLSLSYQEPLTIVRAVANTCSMTVAGATSTASTTCATLGTPIRLSQRPADQSFVLNTNTRYLHPEVLRYAERILATLPDHLDRVFLVNSGSEANELAIRLVRTATGRTDIRIAGSRLPRQHLDADRRESVQVQRTRWSRRARDLGSRAPVS